MSVQYALNGFTVYLVDLEGFGYSDGNRINSLSIEKFHNQISTLLKQCDPNLPTFLLGHSMGGLTVNTFLGLNAKIVERLAGVIYSAPFFGMPEYAKLNFFEKIMVGVLA